MSVSRAFLTAGTKLSAVLGFFAVAAVAGTLIACVLTPGIALAGTAAKQQIGVFQDLPSSLKITALDQKTRMYAMDGKKKVLLASFFNQNRDVIKWDDVPATVKNAAIAGEDVRFYKHGAIDPNGIARAVVSNLKHQDIQGASTITQQYVKNVCVQQAEQTTDKAKMQAGYEECTAPSLNRKIREMRLAIGVEKEYSKDQILLGYLNIAGFGGRTYGIEAAAHYYFDESAKDLDAGQAATLLSIVNNPEKFRLDRKENLAGAEKRRNYILGVELKHGMISQADYDKFSKADISLKLTPPSTGCQTAGAAAFFCTYVVNTIYSSPEFGKTLTERKDNLNTKGWTINTTVDLNLQKKAQKAVDLYVPQKPGAADVGAATTSVQVGTGRVLTMVQNKTFKPNGAKQRTKYSAVNYNTDQLLGAGGGFQPGSTFKAFNMIGWLKSGHSLNQQVNGDARTIPKSNFTACGKVYDYGPYPFKNDENEKGNYTVQEGTARSINGVFLSMAEEQDLCSMRDIAQSLGAKNALMARNSKGQLVRDKNGVPENAQIEATPAGAIGTGSSIAPLDMAVAYATIANKGVRCDATGIDSITDSDGKKLALPVADCRRVQPEDVMIAAGYDLRNPVLGYNGSGNGTMSIDRLGDGKYMFGKTGTTDFAKDTWAMGSTTKVATAVWVGNVTGHSNLRFVSAPHSCNISGMANMRHCIFQAVQRTMNAKYGGASSWPTPASQYLTGGKAIVHADARPHSTPAKSDKKDAKDE